VTGYSFHPAAESEALEAAHYYESQVPGLSHAFRSELETAIQFLLEHPKAAPVERGSLRRKGLQRFPYSLIYAVESGEIRFYALQHQSRRPAYWIARTRQG
jgi:plasmid stabilization system protein ParE